MTNEEPTVTEEVNAMRALDRVLAPLDHETRGRVMRWAEDRLLTSPERKISREMLAEVKAGVEAINERASQLNVQPRQLVHALSAMRERKVAPLEVRQEIEQTEQQLQNSDA